MGNTLILFGVLLIIIGLVYNLLARFGIPTLPGDILIRGENSTFYFPVVTSIVLSIVLTVILNIFR